MAGGSGQVLAHISPSRMHDGVLYGLTQVQGLAQVYLNCASMFGQLWYIHTLQASTHWSTLVLLNQHQRDIRHLVR